MTIKNNLTNYDKNVNSRLNTIDDIFSNFFEDFHKLTHPIYENKSVSPKIDFYEMEWQGFFGQILCRVIISVFYWC